MRKWYMGLDMKPLIQVDQMHQILHQQEYRLHYHSLLYQINLFLQDLSKYYPYQQTLKLQLLLRQRTEY